MPASPPAWPDAPRSALRLNTRGWLSATRNWDGKFQINGDGSSWQNIDWAITASSLNMSGQQNVTLSGLNVALHTDGPDLALTNLTLPDTSASSGSAPFQVAHPASSAGARPEPVAGVVANADNRLAVSELIAAQPAPTTAPSTPAKLKGTIAAAGPATRPTALRTLSGSGDMNFATQAWWLKLSGRGWPAPQLEGEPLAFNVNAQGSRDMLKLNDLSFYAAGAEAHVNGTYVYAEPAPVHMQLDLSHQQAGPRKNSLQAERVQTVAAVTGVPPAAVPDSDLINGDIRGTVMLTGKMKDGVDLTIKGKLAGRNVRFRGHKIGDFDGSIDGKADDVLAKVHTDQFELLGAKWGLSAFYEFDKGATTIGVSVDNLRLEDPRVQKLLQRDDLAGDFRGQWNLYLPGIKSHSERMGGTGWLNGKNLLLPNFAASDFHADFLLKDGKVSIDPIELRRPAIEVAGTVVGSAVKAALSSTTAPFETDSAMPPKIDGDGHIRLGVSINLADPDHITISKLSLVHWPFPMPAAGAALSLDGGSDSITVDLPDELASAARPAACST